MPGDEPEPAELWIDSGAPDQPAGSAGNLTGPAPGSGGTARTRWIALAVGFVVLVAVIAVQHFATGGPSASPGTPTGTASSRVIEPSPTPSDRGRPSATGAGTSTSEPRTSVPLDSAKAELSQLKAAASSARQAAGDALSSAVASTTTDAPDTTSPVRTTVAKRAGAGNWELMGYGPAGVIRYHPATGALTVTPVPPVSSDNVLSFVVTGNGAIIRSMDNVDGYLVIDGKAAAPLTGLLGRGTRVLPGPDPQRVWVVTETQPDGGSSTADIGGLAGPGQDPPHVALTMVGTDGKPTGSKIDIPYAMLVAGGYGVTSDASGYALVYGVGGTYDVQPDGPHLVTHGTLLAVGPTRFLVYECDDLGRCGAAVVNRKDGSRRSLPGLAPRVGYQTANGVISPDGHTAALLQYATNGTKVILINLQTGSSHVLDVAANGTGTADSTLVFSPDGRYLVVDGVTGVVTIDTRTGRVGSPLPIPPVSALAVRPAG